MKCFLTLGLIGFSLLSLRAAPEYPEMGPDIFDPKSDASALVSAALAQAKAGHKHVLLMFGANWEPWSRSMHRVFDSDANVAKTLRENYVLVMVDSNWRHGSKRNHELNLRYGNPLHEGLPVFVILDATGEKLTTQESGVLEEGKGHSAEKVNAFLVKWAPQK